MATLAGEADGRGLGVAIVVSRFNQPVSKRLLDGCQRKLAAAGCEDVDTIWVPGAFEIPLAAQAAAETGRYRAVVALGAVIRGKTAHFDYVCRAVTDGVREVTLESGVPVAFGVLTTDSVGQALERSAAPGESGSNKGEEAAAVALEMAALLERVAALQ